MATLGDMVRTRRAAAALGAVGLLLGACSSGSPAATPASTSTSSVTPSSSSSTAAPSSPTTKPTPKGDPNVPPAARAHTKAGAKAFVVAYMDAVNATAKEPRRGVLERLALRSCKSCRNYETQVDDLVKRHRHYGNLLVRLGEPEVTAYKAETTRVFVTVDQLAGRVVDLNGRTALTYKAGHYAADFALSWTHTGWQVAKIYDAT